MALEERPAGEHLEWRDLEVEDRIRGHVHDACDLSVTGRNSYQNLSAGYTLVFRYVTTDPQRPRREGPSVRMLAVYNILRQEIESYMDQVLQPLGANLSDVEFLESMTPKLSTFQRGSDAITFILRYPIRYYFAKGYDTAAPDDLSFKELHTGRFRARLEVRGWESTIKVILTTTFLQRIMHMAPVENTIKRLSPRLKFTPERRCIYLLRSKIDRSASISNGKNDSRTASTGASARWLSGSFMAAFDHWSLLITRDKGQLDGSILCQLTVLGNGRISFDVTEKPTLAQDALKTGQCCGFTMCSNEVIDKQALETIKSMGLFYNVMNNNCQTFCSRLFERIRQVTSSSELYSGQQELHWDAEEITKRRAIELVDYIVFRVVASSKATTHDFAKTPPSLNRAILVFINFLTLGILYQSYWQLSRGIYSLLVLALVFHSLYGDSGLFRFLRRTPRPDAEARGNEETAKLTDFVIDYFKDYFKVEG